MRIALLQTPLSFQEMNQLNREFPHFLFLTSSRFSQANLEHWPNVEVLFGGRLAKEELKAAQKLKWIHCPTSQINRLCIKEIEQLGDILVTQTLDENCFQAGEFVIAAVYAFAKNIIPWREAAKSPRHIWDSKLRNTMWTLKDKTFLQIGLNKAGIEIAKRASQAEMKVWGMSEKHSFYPYCHQYYSMQELETVLPAADIISLTLPSEQVYEKLLGKKELSIMKEGSILSVMGSRKCIDEDALAELGSLEKWRGILIDADYQYPVPQNSKLWGIPNILITPEVAPRPKSASHESFKTFRYNLRQYILGNFSEMRNLIDPSILLFLAEQ